MAVVRQNTVGGSNASATNHTISFGFTAAAGRTLICLFGNSAGSATFSGLSSGWNIIQVATGTRSLSPALAYKVAAGGETSLAVTLNTAGVLDFIVLEYSGLDTSSPLDQSAENESVQTGAGSNACATGTTASLSVSDGFAVSAWMGDAITWPGSSYSFTNGSSEVLKYTSGATGLLIAEKQLASSSGFSETVTGTANDQIYGCVAVFKQAVAASSFPVRRAFPAPILNF